MDIRKIAVAATSVAISLGLYMIGSAHAKTPENVFQKKLSNGLDVIIVENKTVPLATVSISAKNGGYTEPPDYNGLSHFYEHMFFKGNAVIPNQEKFHEKIKELGISYNGYTSRESVVYFFTLPKSNVNAGLKFMNDAIRTPLFDEKEIEKEKGAVLGEYDRNESSPFFHLHRAIEQKVYWKYFSRVDVIGDRNVIKTVTKKKMDVIKNKFYVPNNCALIIVGDVEHNKVFNESEKLFKDWKKGEDPFKKDPIPEHPPIKKTESFIMNYPAKNPIISAKWQGPNIGKDDKSTYALDVFFTALNLPNSKFQKNLVDTGLASYVSMSYYSQKSAGDISLSASTTPDKIDSLKKKILEEFEKMKNKDYVSNEDIENAKKSIEINYLYNQENGQKYASETLGFWWNVSGLDYYFNYNENAKKVTKDDIYKSLNKYFFGKKYVMGLLINKEDQIKNNVKF
ncbi:MAG: pitrilysin family protein [Candidatus Sericytochromatia bacterium]